jgi:PAS domain S-box-containing protein
VEIPSVVLYLDRVREFLWLWDGESIFSVKARSNQIPPWVEDGVDLTIRGEISGGTELSLSELHLVRGSPVRPPEPIDGRFLLGGQPADLSRSPRYVFLEGTLRAVRQVGQHTEFDLVRAEGTVTARLPLPSGIVPGLWEGRAVRLAGLLRRREAGEKEPGRLLLEAFAQTLRLVGAEGQTGRLVLANGVQVWALQGEERSTPQPIEIEGAICHYDPDWSSAWVWDGKHNIFVNIDPADAPSWLVKGASVTLRGTVVADEGFQSSRLEFSPGSSLSHPPALEGKDRLRQPDGIHELHSLYVALEGWAESTRRIDDRHVMINFICAGRSVECIVVVSPSDTPDWTGQFLRVVGIFHGNRRDAEGALRLQLRAMKSDVSILGRLEDDPRFDLPATPVDEIEVAYAPGWIRVEGTVQGQVPGKKILLRDASGQITLQAPYVLPFTPGTRLEAIGRRGFDESGPYLSEAICRVLPPALTEPPASALGLARLVHDLGNDRAREALPVRLRGRVLYRHRTEPWFYLQDATGAVRVELPSGTSPPTVGTAAEVAGATAAGIVAPRVHARSWTGHTRFSAPPVTVPIELDQALSGLYEGQLVSMTGYVRASSRTAEKVEFEMITPKGRFVALVGFSTALFQFQGAIVRVRGVCESTADPHGQFNGIRVLVDSLADVTLLEARPDRPFERLFLSVPELKRFGTLEGADRFVGVRGVVTYCGPEGMLVLQEGAQSLRVHTATRDPCLPGQIVEAVGLPGWEGGGLFLHEAVFRAVGAHPPLQPEALSVLDLGDRSLDHRLIRTSGELLQIVAYEDHHELVLRHPLDGRLFQAHAVSGMVLALETGSTLEVTGIFASSGRNEKGAEVPRLLLRSLDDLVVLAPPNRWTTERLKRILLTLGGGTLVAFLGLGMLSHRVRRQTAQIQQGLVKEADLENRHRTIVENASDVIFTASPGGQLISLNDAGLRLLGYDPATIPTLNLRELIVEADTPLPDLATLPDGTVVFSCRLLNQADNILVWVEIHACLLRREGDAPIILGVARDITAHKATEAALAAARDTAEANARARGAFLTTMSHELRTPMNGVIGMANLLLGHPLGPDQRGFAKTILESAEALLVILNDILDFSRIEAGKLRLESVDFDLEETVGKVLSLLAGTAEEKGLELICLLRHEAAPKLHGDSGRLRQILLNLVGNALKFTEAGEVVLEVTILRQGPAGPILRFEVRDTGIGLSPEAISRLFQPFEQADSSTTRRFGGTGLGLAICRQIVEGMGGEIGAAPAPGGGALFWFTLPFSAPARGVDARQPPAKDGNQRVLIVAPAEIQREACAHYLKVFGCEVAGCDTMPAALLQFDQASVEGKGFDAVLVDHRPPHCDGLSLARELRARPSGRAVRLVALRPFGLHEASTAFTAAGIDATANKPVLPSDLLSALTSQAPLESGPAPFSGAAHQKAVPLREDHPLRVLVVEDNAVNQRVARLLLARMGCTVEVVGNGLEALQAVERSPYDLLLMDCQMPEMDGFEATALIRAGSHQPKVKIVAMTADAMSEAKDRCLAAGMDAYISKPVHPEGLRKVLAGVLTPSETSSGDDGGPSEQALS